MPNASGAIIPGFNFSTGITRPRHPLLAAGTLALLEAGDPLQATVGVPNLLPNLASTVVEQRAPGAGAGWGYTEDSGAGRWTRKRTTGGGLNGKSAAESGSSRVRYRAPAALNNLVKSLRTQTLVWYMVGRVTALPGTLFSGRQGMLDWFNYDAIPGTGQGGLQLYAQFDQAASPAGTAWLRLWSNQGAGGSVSAFGNTTGGVGWSGGALRVPVGATFSMVVSYSDTQSSDLQAMLGWSTASGAGWGLTHYLAGIEDVQTSGRSWTAVLNDVEQWRQQQCETPGGQYYADTV